MAAIAAKEKAIEGGEEQARIHRIRFTVTSRNVEALERGELQGMAERESSMCCKSSTFVSAQGEDMKP